ncbi:catalase family peroxidase [Lysobacter sp. TAF61]|uniref:catalase family peroxidase n=1 Tax=Lysobacter sp. TAF61 TaxID=3233072 RepID=UPI003F9CB1D8
MVDALHTAFGDHHVRAVHAKGVMVTGTFTPSREASSLSKGSLFREHSVPVLVRFSDFTGIPDIPDTDGHANPRGMAIKFKLADGSSMDVVSHSFNGFPTATAAEFRELLIAIGSSGPDAAKPTALDTFLQSHPVAKTFLTTQKPLAQSYLSLSYFGVNAFQFTNASGAKAYVRYRLIPVAGEAFLSRQAIAAAGPDYLSKELPGHLGKGAVQYRWQAQIAAPGDVIDNPSVAWPEDRKLVELGTIRIEAMAPDEARLDRSTVFLPLNVPDGIVAADPMLTIRHGAYPISFAHRQSAQEPVAAASK